MDFKGLTSKGIILVFFANAYDMTNEKGQPMSGCTVHYLFWGEHGEALWSQAEFNPLKPVGVQRAKCSIDKELRESLVVAPALYEGEFVMTVGGDGKPVNKLVDIKYISHVDIVPHIINGFVAPGGYSSEEAAEILGLAEPRPAENKPADKPAEAAKGNK